MHGAKGVPWEVGQVGDYHGEGREGRWISVTQVLSWHPSCYWAASEPSPCSHPALWNWFSWIDTLPLAKKRNGGFIQLRGVILTQEVNQTYKTLHTHKIKRSKYAAPIPKVHISSRESVVELSVQRAAQSCSFGECQSCWDGLLGDATAWVFYASVSHPNKLNGLNSH